jgi:hypothetical protein
MSVSLARASCLLAALAVTIAVFTPTGAAQRQAFATPPNLLCEGGGGHWDCHLFNATPISWWVNGKRVPAFDAKNHASGRCALNERVGVKVYFYTDRLGELGRSILCPAQMP